MLPSKLSLFKESFVSLDSDDSVRASLFSPTAVNGTMSFQSTPMDHNSTLTPMSVVVAEQSIRMADCFEKLANNVNAPADMSKLVDEKLEAHQAQVISSVQQMLGNFLTEMKETIRDRD
jgi:hypothetical protein